MKRKYLWVLILIPVIFCMTTACGKKVEEEKDHTKTIELSDTEFGMKTTFTYDEEENYTDIEYDEESGKSKELSFENKDYNLEFEMYYTDMRTESYNDLEENRSSQKNYKEYKFGTFKAYTYGRNNSSMDMNILLDIDRDDIAKVLFVTMKKEEDDDSTTIVELFENPKVQEFFNSMKMEYIQ